MENAILSGNTAAGSRRGIAYYLYGLQPASFDLKLPEAGVFVRRCGDIHAVVSEVAREEFCGEDAEARMQDLTWLAPRACRHEAVIERVMDAGPVLPARFATLFSSLDALEDFVREHHDIICAFLAGLEGKREWAVKGVLDRRRASAALAAPVAADRSPGREYLRRRHAEADAKAEVNEWWRSTCDLLSRALRARASDFRQRKPWHAAPGHDGAEPVLNWAFLVPIGGEPEFGELVRKFDEELSVRGLSLFLSGPWPPYSFAPALGEP